MWNISSGRDYTDLQARARFSAHNRYCLKVLLSPDLKCASRRCKLAGGADQTHRHLATCSADTTIKVWSLAALDSATDSTSSSNGLSSNITSMGWGPPSPSPSSQHINPTLEKTLYGHQRWVWDLAFSADSAYLVSASSDHSARLWDVASGQTVRQYAGHSKPCVAVALNDSASVPGPYTAPADDGLPVNIG